MDQSLKNSLTRSEDKMPSQFWQAAMNSEEGDEFRMERPYKIFFKDLFRFKENEMAAKKKERLMSRTMKIYQKTTFSSRMKSRSHLGQLAFYAEAGGSSYENLGLDPTLILRLTEGADRKRTVHEFINDERDRFLLEEKKNVIVGNEDSTFIRARLPFIFCFPESYLLS